MISRIHIDHIRQQIELVDEELRHLREVRAGWQKLYDTAQALAGVPATLPPKQPESNDGQTIVLPAAEPAPAQGPTSGAWEMPLDPKVERAHERFQRTHAAEVCGAEYGSTACALEPGHEGDHDDRLGARWPREAEAGGER